MNLHIRGGLVVDPANHVEQELDLYIADGKVAASGDPPPGFVADDIIDASGLMVLPGLVDLCVRLGEPGEEHKATIASETAAAASGGITRMVCAPDTSPVIDTPAMVRMVHDRAEACGKTHVHPLAAMTRGLEGERLSDMALLQDAGCVAVSNGLKAMQNTLVLRRAMQYASTYDLPVFSTPLDPWLVGNGVVHEGAVSTHLGLPAIPEAAETVGVARDLALTETSGARTHLSLISSGRAVEMIAEARARGLPVSASVDIHHLHLNENHIGAFDTQYKVFPPLRTERDQHGLVQGLLDGTIDAICSDHQPHGSDAKLAPFVEAAAGISGLDTLLSLTLKLVDEGRLPLSLAIAAVTINPARIAGIDGGHLGAGASADLCLFDPAMEWRVDRESMVSRGKNTPWSGHTLKGKVVSTWISGRLVHSLQS